MKLTFKKEKKETGLGSFGTQPSTCVKHNKKHIGNIFYSRWKSIWEIQIAVKQIPTKEDPCKFRWVFPKQKFSTEPEARKYIKEHLESILNKHNFELHYFEDN